jgi:hypothetical protein
MGLESFFIKVIAQPQIEISSLEHDPNLLVERDSVDPEQLAVLITGCFSWYEQCADAMWDVVQQLPSEQGQWSLEILGNLCAARNREGFKVLLDNQYASKRRSFTQQFGNIYFKTLPGEPFFRKLRWNKVLSWLTFRSEK